jgi:RimJ/RimL family protein N-acetyltransferase
VRFVPFPPATREQAAASLERLIGGRALAQPGDHLDLAVSLRDGTVVGGVAAYLHELEHETLEVAWMFERVHAGQGYATESVRSMFALLFTQLQARRLVARVDERNAASRRLCERLGMRAEAHLVENEWVKGELTSEVDYALLAREWSSASTQ